MNTQNIDRYNASQADYSSVRSQVEGQCNGFEIGDDKVSISSKMNHETVQNQNLSNVLSQIQDDGPACTGVPKRDNLYNLNENKKDVYAGRQQTGNNQENECNARHDPAVELQQINRPSQEVSTVNSNKKLWAQSFLFIVVILAVGFYLVRLDMRTEQLEASLLKHEKSIQNSISVYSNTISPDIVNINKNLQDVKNTLGLLNVINDVADVKLAPLPDAEPSFVEPQKSLHEKVIVEASGKLTAEVSGIEAIINDKHAVTENAETQTAIKTKPFPVQEKLVPVTEAPKVASGWTVVLASFSDRNRAVKASEKILESGFEPIIQTASVNGDNVYRLLVDGFNDRSEAEVFVGLAGDLFQLKGGWIIKVGNI